jgi:hypothetical protein
MYLPSLEEETAMLLKRTKALSSEILLRIKVIDGGLAPGLGFSKYKSLSLENPLLRAYELKNSNITNLRRMCIAFLLLVSNTNFGHFITNRPLFRKGLDLITAREHLLANIVTLSISVF